MIENPNPLVRIELRETSEAGIFALDVAIRTSESEDGIEARYENGEGFLIRAQPYVTS